MELLQSVLRDHFINFTCTSQRYSLYHRHILKPFVTSFKLTMEVLIQPF